MEILFELDGKFKKIELGEVNFFIGSNSSGKSVLLNNLNNILVGNSDSALINGIKSQKGLFNVVFIDQFRDLDADINLKTTSSTYINNLKPFIKENQEEILETFQATTDKLYEKFISEHPNKFIYDLSNSELNFDLEKFAKLSSILFSLNFHEIPSMAAKEEFYILQKIETIEKNIHTVLIVDDIDRYLDFNIIKKIIKVAVEKNCTLIMSTKNKYMLNEIKKATFFKVDCEKIDFISKIKLDLFLEIDENNNFDDFILSPENLYTKEEILKRAEKNILNMINDLKI